LAGEVATIRNGNHEVLIKKTLSDWGNAPRPLAWGLGDEPRATYMNEMAKYVASWRKFAPGEPVTTVVMHSDVSAAKTVGFDALANDVYPFFSKDNPNRYMGRDYTAWIDKTKILRASVNVPWMMGQTYQEPWGPIEIAPSGNIVYLPGSAPHWVMPSPKQVAWQTLAAVAKGAQGMFYFAYRLTPSPKLKWAPASKLPAKVSVPTDSGAPMGLVHMNGASTPQYEAMAEAFGWVAKHRPFLAKLRYAPAGEQLKVSGNYANAASVFVHSDSGKLYLIAASSYMSTPEAQAFRIVFASQAMAIRNIETGVVANLNAATDGMATVLRMPPATASIFEIVKDN
ncbi:MAG: beta-galactosidase, partial [Burkholderiaceae bacterium]